MMDILEKNFVAPNDLDQCDLLKDFARTVNKMGLKGYKLENLSGPYIHAENNSRLYTIKYSVDSKFNKTYERMKYAKQT